MDIETFTLFSNDLGGVASLTHVYTACGGENCSPQLNWINTPKRTKSMAITMHDPDAPTGGGGFWHWIVFNLPPNIQSLPKNAGAVKSHLLPAVAIQSKNDYGFYGYGGPNPPAGNGFHSYIITLHALDIEKLDFTQDSLADAIGFALWEHTIQKASIISYYKT